jgi:hypothetical protein
MIASGAADVRVALKSPAMAHFLAGVNLFAHRRLFHVLLTALMALRPDAAADAAISRMLMAAGSGPQVPELIRTCGDLIPAATLERHLHDAWRALRDPYSGLPFAAGLAILAAMYDTPAICARFDALKPPELAGLLKNDIAYRVAAPDHARFAAFLVRIAECGEGVHRLEELARALLFSTSHPVVSVIFVTVTGVKRVGEIVQTMGELADSAAAHRHWQFEAIVAAVADWGEVEERREAAKEFLVLAVEKGFARVVELRGIFLKIAGVVTIDEAKAIIAGAFRGDSLTDREWGLAAAIFAAFPEKREELMREFPIKVRPTDAIPIEFLNAVYGEKSIFDTLGVGQGDPAS